MTNVTNVSLILGRRRQGKTTLALALALARHDTVVFWDVNDQLMGWPYLTHDPAHVRNLLELDIERILIVVKPQRGAMREQFAGLVDAVFQWEDLALVVDEASELQGPGWMDEGLEHLTRRWNDDSTLIQATHRLRDANPLVRQNATDTYLFATSYRPDLEIMNQHYGVEVAATVARLEKWQAVHVWLEAGGQTAYAIWDRPQTWHVPLEVEGWKKRKMS